MLNSTMLSFEKIYVLGDIHGNFEYLCCLIRGLAPDSLLIQVGDFGLGFKSYERDLLDLKTINDLLIQKKVNLFIIRGNHSNPEYWKKNLEYSNLKLIPDYSQIKINNKKYLFVGGAISVDRIERKANKDYWIQEKVDYLSDEDLLKLDKTDVLILHSAPDFAFPAGYDSGIVRYYSNLDVTLLANLMFEREYLRRLVDTVKPKYVFYGHFHDSKEQKIDRGYECVYSLLNINEMVEFIE